MVPTREPPTRVCRAPGCSVLLVREGLFMCRAHWAKVPAAIQARVVLAYRRDFLGLEYRDAVEAAMRAVAAREGSGG